MNNQSTALLFELSRPCRRCHRLPTCDVSADDLVPPHHLATDPPPLPEVAESDLIRHFTNLSTRNMSIDTNFYPLGSCTMKYNPKRHERYASDPAFAGLHPLQDDDTVQGMLEILWEMQNFLTEISGLPAISLQPAAGAQGELAALYVAAAYFRDTNQPGRKTVLVPDSAHGTNPASAVLAGFNAVTVKSDAKGLVDLADLKAKLGADTAVFMITNPNTLGLFEQQIQTITDMVHAAGGLVYLDGANMNAILGIARPGDFGADMQHYNVHKTFTGPHGGGGPGSGPIAVRDFLAPYLPAPTVGRRVGSGQSGVDSSAVGGDGRTHNLANYSASTRPTAHSPPPTYYLNFDMPKSIGRVRSFFGNVGILFRGYAYIRTLGPDGLKRVSEQAVLNANYLLSRIKHAIDVPHGDRCMHEFVASAKALRREKKISAMDIGKRLLDFGYHAPTVYFPLVVPEALMMEPTETESKETLDAFAAVLLQIIAEDAATLHAAPHTLGLCRPDEVKAAKEPILRWTA